MWAGVQKKFIPISVKDLQTSMLTTFSLRRLTISASCVHLYTDRWRRRFLSILSWPLVLFILLLCFFFAIRNMADDTLLRVTHLKQFPVLNWWDLQGRFETVVLPVHIMAYSKHSQYWHTEKGWKHWAHVTQTRKARPCQNAAVTPTALHVLYVPWR